MSYERWHETRRISARSNRPSGGSRTRDMSRQLGVLDAYAHEVAPFGITLAEPGMVASKEYASDTRGG
jgi:hypothetical protein